MLKQWLLVALAALGLAACGEVTAEPQDQMAVSVVPAPKSAVLTGDTLILAADARVAVPIGDRALLQTRRQFLALVDLYAGVSLNRARTGAGIRFVRDNSVEGAEAYRIDITKHGVTVSASGDAGHFYGAMTLAQMLDGDDGTLAPLPIGVIEDSPRLAWRGVMLDVARHYRSVAFIKEFLDWMAVHKLNVFHWHLTDDQAWRLEIKKYPKLTEVGACRVPAGDGPRADVDDATGKPRQYCGYYTQDQVREIVAYAAERHITVMPEIDLPGHATAAVAAYPQFGTVAPFEGDMSDWGIFQNTFNLEDETFTFLEDVMTETLALFPSKFVHIGGDEVATNQWAASGRIKERMAELGLHDVHEIQAYFTRHFADYLAKRGRRLIGWDEILEGGSIADSAIMSWRGTKGGIAAAKEGRQVVMAPSSIYYTDYRQSRSRYEEPGREHVQTLKDVYDFEPVSDELSETEKAAVLGAQVTIFSEHMRTEARVEHMAFPRALALAETVWSPPGAKDFDGFVSRLMDHWPRLQALGLTPADSAFGVEFQVKTLDSDQRLVTLNNQVGQGEIRYTLDGSDPDASSSLYSSPVTAGAGQTITAAAFHEGRALSRPRAKPLDRLSLSERTSDELALCSMELAIKLDDDYPRDGKRAALLVDIMKPCWTYDAPDMTGVTGIEITVGNLPYNFQIGDMIERVSLMEPQTEVGEVLVFKDSCDGGIELARLPLAPAAESYGLTTLTAPLDGAAADATALCFHMAAHHYEPLWAIDRVRLRAD